jgi:hypothetical protein
MTEGRHEDSPRGRRDGLSPCLRTPGCAWPRAGSARRRTRTPWMPGATGRLEPGSPPISAPTLAGLTPALRSYNGGRGRRLSIRGRILPRQSVTGRWGGAYGLGSASPSRGAQRPRVAADSRGSGGAVTPGPNLPGLACPGRYKCHVPWRPDAARRAAPAPGPHAPSGSRMAGRGAPSSSARSPAAVCHEQRDRRPRLALP